ncbi:hypothetical protein [Segatella hominis]|uniref:Starch-binding protein n=1 Tax=Segatella hominis TaxID=2518605 RepID=A0A4Y8VV28_9BACT|nr:hypothetical protein [Segatella hominis]TFH84469.1 hypothetical protein EXN75_01335 [Segatella hominis]
MKKFTFIAMLLAVFAMTAKAQVMDKYFFKVPTDKMSEGWIIQDAGNFAATPGKDYLEVQNKKNGGRMLNYFWNEAAWAGVDPATLPNHTYKFTMDLNMSNMAARADMEFVLLPVDMCTPTDTRVSTHNYHWYKVNDGDDYFFRWRVGEKPAAANGDYTIWINEEPTAKNDWSQTTEETLTLSSQTTYKFAVVINTEANTATYTISDAEGNPLKTGVHNYTCEEDRAGIFVFGMNGTSTHQLSNIGLSYEAEGPFAQEPSVDLLAAIGQQRAYYVTFPEGHTLHWTQLGDAEGIDGTAYADGEECSVAYSDAIDTREMETSGEGGSKIIFCNKTGQLKVWTTLEDDETNKSNEVVNDVVCQQITMPTPSASIVNVEEGYKKVYQIVADNSETLMKPTVTIHYKKTVGGVTTEGNVLTGETIALDGQGSLELYSYDGTHPVEMPWYAPSEKVTVENNVEYVVADKKDYAWTKEECDAAKTGFTVTEIVDNANKSHWDRAYSTQMYGYDANGNSTACTEADAANYVSTKKGFGIFDMASIGTDNAKWNVQVPEDATTAFAPLAPTADFIANSKYEASAWSIFPYEGIVYYNIAVTNAALSLDAKYTSDDVEKPNFYIVHTRGGYDRPDKGDCNKTTVCVAGENFNLNRYDTALCDVKVMTYKGFVPGVSGIKNVNTAETSASAVKKVVTKNGVVIVKDGKTFSVAGAQLK